jgi:hypothetical protein
VQATGNDGAQGDAIFAAGGIDNSHAEYVEFTLAGGAKIQVPKYIPLSITFTQPGLFAKREVKAVGFTTSGNATAVKVLDVPTGWTVAVTYSGNAGTFTITAPDATPAFEAFVFVSDAAGNTVMRTLALRSTTATTLCAQCCYNGAAWVDCYVTTDALSTTAVWSGNSDAYYAGARSYRDGRANTAAIPSAGNAAVQLCKDLGAGWYLPAYEELYAMSSGSAYSSSNNKAGAGILKGNWHWSSTEYYGNGGRRSTTDTYYQYTAVVVNSSGTLDIYNKNSANLYVRCAWRP